MDIKELNQMISPELKLKFKEFLSKFNTTPVVPPVSSPAAPVVPPAAVSAPAPVQMGEGLLQDGVTVVKYNTPELQEGSVITVVTPEGEMAAPEGDHTLQDGTVITVAMEGGNSVVKAIKKAEAQPEQPMAAPASPAAPVAPQIAAQIAGFESQLKTFVSDKDTMVQKFEAQNAKIEAQTNEIESLKASLHEFASVISEVFEIPSGNPVEAPRNKFASGLEAKANKIEKFTKNK